MVFSRIRRLTWWHFKGTARSNWPRFRSSIVEWTSLLGEDLEAVGQGPRLPPSVRRSTAQRLFTVARANQILLIGALVSHCVFPIVAAVSILVADARSISDLLLPSVLVAIMYTWPFAWRLWVTYFGRGRFRVIRQSSPVALALRAIGSCAYLVTSPASTHAAQVEWVSKDLRLAERAFLRGPHRFGTIPRTSPRRKHLTLHARHVAAALRKAELQLDTDPVAGARELSRLLIVAAENHASGRLGALLPEEELKDLEPVTDHTAVRETLHLVIALAIVGAVGWLGTWYGGKIGVESPWSLIPAAIAAVLVFPRLRRTGPDLLISYLGP
ncbi:hypothetical protein AB0F18_13960 [Streptomyces sp. NPDC029216]|uniref:hypothetical protein n=1 Tax=Streptomyces sp. NPDC029216 TaxID=3154701 RepID=UPI0033CC890F